MRSHVDVHSSNLQPLRITIMFLNVKLIWATFKALSQNEVEDV